MGVLIDLDAVLAETPTVLWRGTEYKVADVPVSKLLKLSQMADAAGEDERVWLNLQEQIKVLVPNAPDEFYEELGLQQTIVLINGITDHATSMGEDRSGKFVKRKS